MLLAGVAVHGDRVAVDGEVLAEGHPVRDAWIGQPDPVMNASNHPVGYCDLPEEAQFRERPCGCGCGEISTRDFLPGHDVRAFQDRVRRMFAGSALEFIRWVDRMAGEHGVPVISPTAHTRLSPMINANCSRDRRSLLAFHTPRPEVHASSSVILGK
ncbi:hypothetical protein ACFWPH_02155 [Nocardia sp. NPDC058499]|uniref:hypothetical protein n=1 Tax=Nocardia sp. NPDC058499 TaxID=3346530 RepID=UPI00364A0F93